MQRKKAKRYEVQHYTWGDSWVNTWTECSIRKGAKPKPVTFATRKEAQAELDEFFADVKEAVKAGNMDSGYGRDEFRIVPVGTGNGKITVWLKN